MTAVIKNRESYYTASQWQLFWSRFQANRLAAIGGVVLGIFYFHLFVCRVDCPLFRFSRQPRCRLSGWTAPDDSRL